MFAISMSIIQTACRIKEIDGRVECAPIGVWIEVNIVHTELTESIIKLNEADKNVCALLGCYSSEIGKTKNAIDSFIECKQIGSFSKRSHNNIFNIEAKVEHLFLTMTGKSYARGSQTK